MAWPGSLSVSGQVLCSCRRFKEASIPPLSAFYLDIKEKGRVALLIFQAIEETGGRGKAVVTMSLSKKTAGILTMAFLGNALSGCVGRHVDIKLEKPAVIETKPPEEPVDKQEQAVSEAEVSGRKPLSVDDLILQAQIGLFSEIVKMARSRLLIRILPT